MSKLVVWWQSTYGLLNSCASSPFNLISLQESTSSTEASGTCLLNAFNHFILRWSELDGPGYWNTASVSCTQVDAHMGVSQVTDS